MFVTDDLIKKKARKILQVVNRQVSPKQQVELNQVMVGSHDLRNVTYFDNIGVMVMGVMLMKQLLSIGQLNYVFIYLSTH